MDSTDVRLEQIRRLTVQLQKKYPAEMNAFLNFSGKAEAGLALSLREKEITNVALSVAAQCDWCIALHVKNAVAAGATRDELMEAGFLAVLMHGGPALMYLITLTSSLDELLPDKNRE